MCLYRRTIFSGEGGGIRALLFGCVALAVKYFVKQVVEPGDFGLSRWASGFVDIISLPVLIPFVICILFVLYKGLSFKLINFVHFTLLFLIPLAIFRAIRESSPPSLIPLVLVPALWIIQTEGIAFFIQCMLRKTRWYVIIPSTLGIIALPLAATTSWWAFFTHQTFYGFVFLFVCLIPAVISIIVRYHFIGKGNTLSMLEGPQSPMMSLSSPSATPENE
jgi:hypothetical protein